MTAQIGRALAAYASTDLETRIEAASPQQLIVMLYEGAISAMYAAKAALAEGNIAARGQALSKAIAIVEEGLRGSLDLNGGGEIAQNLSNLYEYISNRLLYANLKMHEPSIDEALKLMTELRQAWEQLDARARAPRPASQPVSPERHAALSYGRI